MATALNASTVALQLERVRRTIPQLWFNENVFLTRLQTREDLEVSTRATRVPLDIQAGGNGGVVNLDGGDMGRGSAGSRAVGTLSNAYYRWAIEWSELAEVANDSSQKSVQNYVEKEVGRGMKNFRAFLTPSFRATAQTSWIRLWPTPLAILRLPSPLPHASPTSR
jgi:hypothetical protein